MAWFPGSQRYYNETPSPRVAYALSAGVQFNAIPESQTHPGFNEFDGNAFTLSLNVRPHFENSAKRGISYSKTVEDASNPTPAPTKKGR